jgi:ankyrin repeat protein
MHLLFLACRGDVSGVEDLLDDGVDVNSIDLDGRTALHIAACEGHVDVVNLLLSRNANIDARDRWGSTAAADAKYYGHVEVFNILKARGAKAPVCELIPCSHHFNFFRFPEIYNHLYIYIYLYVFLENQKNANGSCKSSRSSRI